MAGVLKIALKLLQERAEEPRTTTTALQTSLYLTDPPQNRTDGMLCPIQATSLETLCI